MTYSDIVKAFTQKLKIDFANVHVTSNDVSEGFKRPSFFMEFITPKSVLVSENRRLRTFTLRLSYFPSSRTVNAIELLEIQESLESVFSAGKKIHVGSDVLNTDQGCSCRESDKVLHCDIDFECYLSIDKPEPEAEYIENIEINMTINK